MASIDAAELDRRLGILAAKFPDAPAERLEVALRANNFHVGLAIGALRLPPPTHEEKLETLLVRVGQGIGREVADRELRRASSDLERAAQGLTAELARRHARQSARVAAAKRADELAAARRELLESPLSPALDLTAAKWLSALKAANGGTAPDHEVQTESGAARLHNSS